MQQESFDQAKELESYINSLNHLIKELESCKNFNKPIHIVKLMNKSDWSNQTSLFDLSNKGFQKDFTEVIDQEVRDGIGYLITKVQRKRDQLQKEFDEL